MPTPIRRRFKVDTLLLDQTAPIAVLDVAALITTNDIFSGDLWRELAPDEWQDAVPAATYPVEYKWLEAYFGQALKPDKAVIVLSDDSTAADMKAGLDDAVDDGAAWYQLHYIGNAAADKAIQIAIAEFNQSFEEKTQTLLMSTDVANLTADTGLAADLRNAGLDRAAVIYHPLAQTTERPDGALAGYMLSTEPGAEQWDYKTMAFCSDAGLTSAQMTQLRANGANYVERFKNTAFIHVFPGRTVSGREIRIQWGADWFDVNLQASLANYQFRTALVAFDDDTFNSVDGLIREWHERALAIRLILDYEVNLPDPETIPASVRASGIASFNNVYTATLNSAIDGWQITGNWSIGGI